MKILNSEDFKYEPKSIIVLKSGGLWEENEVEIQIDVPIGGADKVFCPHLEEKYIVRTFRSDGTHFDNIYANCPRVIVAVNEGGYNSTGVCADCILKELKNLTIKN